MYCSKSLLCTIICALMLGFNLQAQIDCNQTQVNNTCSNVPAGIAVTQPTGGASPYNFMWSHNDMLNLDSAMGLAAGDYTVTITDANGDTTTCSFTITSPPDVEVEELLEFNPSCQNDNGRLEITGKPKNNTPESQNLSYSIDGGFTFQSEGIFDNLPEADYLVIVLDGDGCFKSEAPQLVNTPVLEMMLIPECGTGGNIDITLMLTSGTEGDTEYNWEGPGGASYTTENLVDVPQGTYNVTVTDRVGCSGSATVTLDNCCDGSSFCDADVTDSGCTGSNTGSITVNPSNGNPPYSYAWSHDNSLTTNSATNLGAGIYMVTVIDAGGCEDVCNYTVNETPNVMISSVDASAPTCDGLNGGSISIAIGEEIDTESCNIEYSVDGGANYQASPDFTNLPAGSYTVMVKDCNNCTDAETVVLEDAGNPNVFSVNVDCVMNRFLNININISMGTPPYSYAWEGPDGFTANTEDLVGVDNGDYSVTVTDINGCETTAEAKKLDDCGDCGVIGDFVWVDANGNGVQGPDETGLANVEVTLFTASNVISDQTITDENGFYEFVEVPEGTYYLHWSPPSADFESTVPNQGDEETDSDLDGSNGPGTSATLTITGCEVKNYLDAGFFVCSNIGKKVFFDKNENNICDNNETGINGVVIEIWRAHHQTGEFELFGTQTTSTHPDFGTYGYWNACVPPGDYYLKIVSDLNGLALTLADVGDNDNVDSDFTGANGPGTTDVFSITSGTDKCDIGAGFLIEATLGDRVWFDQNGNGNMESTEQGVADVRIRVYDESNHLVQETYTDNDGSYRIAGLGMQLHHVEFTPPAGFAFTLPYAGEEGSSSMVDNSNGQNTTQQFGTICGQHTANINAGLVPGVLPASWLGFSLEQVEQNVRLNWAVADISSVNLFEIERSSNGIDFGIVGTMNATNDDNYQFTDADVTLNEDIYYRIKQIDNNGEMSYSNIQVIKLIKTITNNHLEITPNPTRSTCNILLNSADDSAQWKGIILDEKGSIVISDIIIEANQKQQIDIAHLTPGIYFMSVKMGDKQLVKKIVKQ